VTRRQAGSCGVRFPAGARNFHFSKAPTPALRLTQPPTKSVPVDCFHGVKWPGREADHTSRLRMSVPVPLLPLHVFKQGQQGQLQLFTYFLLTIIVPFSWYSPIQLIQSHSADTVPFSWQSPIQLIQSHSADTVPFSWYSPIQLIQSHSDDTVPFSWYSPIQLIQSHSADTVPFSWYSPIQLIQSHSADRVPFSWYSPIQLIQSHSDDTVPLPTYRSSKLTGRQADNTWSWR